MTKKEKVLCYKLRLLPQSEGKGRGGILSSHKQIAKDLCFNAMAEERQSLFVFVVTGASCLLLVLLWIYARVSVEHIPVKINVHHMRLLLHRLALCPWLPGRHKVSCRGLTFPSISRQEVCQLRLCRTCLSKQKERKEADHSPNPASGFSVLILSRQSWLKNMYAERARFGALGSFFVPLPLLRVVAFSAFSAALRLSTVRGYNLYYHRSITYLGFGGSWSFFRHLQDVLNSGSEAETNAWRIERR